MKKQPEQSPCPPFSLLAEHVAHAEKLSRQRREFVVEHIRQCGYCCDIYNVLSNIDEDLGEAIREGAGIPEVETHPIRTVEQAWAEASLRIDAYEATERRERRWALVFRIGRVAAAACIVIAIGVWFMMHKGDSGQSQPGIAANNGSPAIFAELVTPEGRKPLALNQPIVTDTQPQEIWLDGMHRVVMNSHTKATLKREPRRTEGPYAGKIPYEIQLAQGELFVEVEPGSPFTVKTANARLDITGTKFDVVTGGDKTDLTLLKGSVRFSALDHPQEAVSVTAGHTSTVTARLAPTAPSPTDAVAAVTWARDETLRNAIASRQNKDIDADLLAISAMGHDVWRYSSSPDLDKLDYEKLRDERRQNRLALAALAALPKDKASADWIEVLVISGDIWQFHYDPQLPGSQPLTRLQPHAITRLARHYGLEEKDILKALGLPEAMFTATTAVQDGALGHQYAEALRHWHDAILAAVDMQNPKANDSLKSFSFNASLYLSETRIAAYLWVKNHPEEARRLLADKEYLAMLPTPPALASDGAPDVDEWLKQLREQAATARNCYPATLEWLTAPPPGCAQPTEQQRWLAELVAELMPSSAQLEGKE